MYALVPELFEPEGEFGRGERKKKRHIVILIDLKVIILFYSHTMK